MLTRCMACCNLRQFNSSTAQTIYARHVAVCYRAVAHALSSLIIILTTRRAAGSPGVTLSNPARE